MSEEVIRSAKVKADDDSVMLRVLDAVERDSALTQRSLAKELDVALGLAHTYIKRCIKKGYIKISQAPAKRYAYYLTPHGFSEKAKLTAEYLNQSFCFFRYAKEQIQAVYDQCEHRGWRRLALAGASDLAEIAMLAATLRDVTLLGLVDAHGTEGFALPKLQPEDLSSMEVEAVVVTSLNQAQATYDGINAYMPAERIFTPPLLKIVTSPVSRV